MKFVKSAVFAAGMLAGTAGVSILSSKDAKKVYTHCTAAVYRGKDAVMKVVSTIRENCGDIHADAVEINEKRYAEEEERKVAEARAIIEAYDSKAE